MKHNILSKIKLAIDIVLLAMFIVLFFMDFTGVDLHQWLGIGIGLLAGIHFLLHASWIAEVCKRFFTKTSNRCRLYFLLDGAIAAGFGVMLLTGLVISTWLNLSLSHFAAWKAIHVMSSVVTLVLTLGKVALHWKWIARTSSTGQIASAGVTPRPAGQCQVVNYERRAFMKVMGVTGLASAIGLVGIAHGLSGLKNEDADLAYGLADKNLEGSPIIAESENLANSQNLIIPPAATQAALTAPTTPAVKCSVRCRKGCSYPGRCRRYTDVNGNGRCDLGECL